MPKCYPWVVICAIDIYLWAIYSQVMSPHDGDMDKYEMRRSALQDLIDGLGWGGVTKVAERLGKSPSYVSRMLLPTTKSGFKRIGEDTADLLDVAFPGWMRNEAKISESNVEYGITIRPDRRGIPIIDYIQAGKWRGIADAFPQIGRAHV